MQKEGVASPSFTTSLMEGNPNPTEEEEEIYKWTSVGLYSGEHCLIGIRVISVDIFL